MGQICGGGGGGDGAQEEGGGGGEMLGGTKLKKLGLLVFPFL
jgi:hypothetical protein